jgi:hypothetical protein
VGGTVERACRPDLEILQTALPLRHTPITQQRFFLKINFYWDIFVSQGRGFVVTILINLTLYIIHIAPVIFPHQLPHPLKTMARGFLVLFHIGV